MVAAAATVCTNRRRFKNHCDFMSHRAVGLVVSKGQPGNLPHACKASTSKALPALEIRLPQSLDRGACEPLAALALIGQQPGDAALQSRVVGRQAEFPRDNDHEAGSVAIAGCGGQRLAVVAGESLPVREQAGRGPTAVVELPGQQFGQRLIALLGRGDPINPDGRPGEHGAMVQRFGRIVLQIDTQFREARARLRGLGVAVGGDADGQRGQCDAIMIVDLKRRVLAVGPVPATILALHGPQHVEHLAGHVAQCARRLRIVEGQSRPDDDRPEAPRFRWPLRLPADSSVIFVEAANLARVRQDGGQRGTRGHVEQVRVACGTLLGFLPVQRRAIQILRRLFRRKMAGRGLVRPDFRQAFLNIVQGNWLLCSHQGGSDCDKKQYDPNECRLRLHQQRPRKMRENTNRFQAC